MKTLYCEHCGIQFQTQSGYDHHRNQINGARKNNKKQGIRTGRESSVDLKKKGLL